MAENKVSSDYATNNYFLDINYYGCASDSAFKTRIAI